MPESVYEVLASVRRRQRAALVLRLTMYGLLAGSLAGLVTGTVVIPLAVPFRSS